MHTIKRVLATGFLVFVLAACGAQTTSVAQESAAESAQVTSAEAASASTNSTPTETPEVTAAQTADTTSAETTATAATGIAATTVADALAANQEAHDEASDYVWDAASAVPITLNGDSITVEGNGATVDGSTVTISAAGTYNLTGTLTDGQVVVNSEGEGTVKLILNGVDLTNATSAPINIVSADEAVIILAEGTTNKVTDGTAYVYASADVDEPNAAIFSAADLSIGGTGSLTVDGNYNDAIASKDGLVIASGTIAVTSVDDGIRGKDYVVVRGGTITVDAEGDGLKADNADEAERGYILVENGSVTVTSAGDALDAESDILIADGALTLTTGGGHSATLGTDVSAKGLKAAVGVIVDGGTVAVDAADDAVNTNGSLLVNGGTLTVASGDDALHADLSLTINNGTIDITSSYEGLESGVITVNDGNVKVVSSDDGVNVVDASATGGGMPGRGGRGQAATAYTGTNFLNINGGTLVVDSNGDGLDSNGAIKMTGGTVVVNGPTMNGNGALDYDGGFNVTGGYLVAAGSAGMAQTADTTSRQNALLINFTSAQAAGTLVHVQNSAGENILTFAPAKAFQSLAFTSADLVDGETYTIYTGGSSTGTATDGLYQDGTYSSGTEYESFTVSDVVTMVGTQSRGMR